MMKKTILSVIAIVMNLYCFSKDYVVKSPDGKISVIVSVGQVVRWHATCEEKEVVRATSIGLILKSDKMLGENEKVTKASERKITETLRPVVPNRHSEIDGSCNELIISFKSGYSIEFRAFNDGIAYRFRTNFKEDLVIKNEVAEIEFPEGTKAWYPLEDSFFSHNERIFKYTLLDTIGKNHLASLPALFKANNINVLLTESDIDDYPGMWITGKGPGKIAGTWPRYPDSEQQKNDRDVPVTGTRNFIAQTEGSRAFPWRAFAIAAEDAGLLENELVFKLAKENKIADPSWIRPGQVAWDWWNANNIWGVNFRAGINNDTYKYYIDFASANGIEYIILDEGWYKLGNVLEEVPGIDVYELCQYAASKKVGVILWVVWKSFWDKIDQALPMYEKWGVKGLKIDFMQRDDQKIVGFYHEAAKKAADHHMLLDFHGAYKPDGLSRTWPNVLTREGVKGMENDKWSRDISPEHDVTLPFTRMVPGSMDYTPGAMINYDKENFTPKFTRPSSQGTRAHQVALYVIYESPLQMLSDSPSNYLKEQETVDFITKVPVTWDDTKGLAGKTGDFVIVARRSGKDWFVGAITDWTSRTLDVDLSFLPAGNYQAEIYQDGINADKYASDYKIVKTAVKQGARLKIQLAPGGGWAARITPVE